MVLIESESLSGSPAREIISDACVAVDAASLDLAKMLIAQIGALADLFRDEEAVQRMVPIVEGEKTVCLLWKRASWPSRKQPVFRFHDQTHVHGRVWAMLPFVVV